MSEHARIAPSALSLTIACEGSVQLQEQVPPCPDTEEEAEGIAAHVVAMAHAANLATAWTIGKKFDSKGREWKIDLDMYEGAQMYARALGGPHGNLRLEDGVKVSDVHHDECWGTPDAWRAFLPGDTYIPSVMAANTISQGTSNAIQNGKVMRPIVRVGDYKYGHRFVDEFECDQTVAYARGIIERLGLNESEVLLELIIVQPRCFSAEPVRMWRVNAVDVRTLVSKAHYAAYRALQDDPPTKTGEHCLDCRARHLCKTLRYGTSHIVTYAGTAEPTPLDVVSMGQELRILDDAAKQLEARRTGLKAQVEAHVRAGYAVPLWTLKPGRAVLAYNEDVTPDHMAAVGDALGVNIRKPAAVMTPTQAIVAGIDESIIGEYATRAKPAMYLKPDDTTAARKLFLGVSRT